MQINIPADKIPHWIATNRIVGLSLDKLASGKLIPCEVRRDELGEIRVPIVGEMTTDDFYALAARLGLEILPSKFATAQECESHRLHVRRMSERAEMARGLREERETPAWKGGES
jgi:hypothetical protein